jgi:hypothetical protein
VGQGKQATGYSITSSAHESFNHSREEECDVADWTLLGVQRLLVLVLELVLVPALLV